MLFAAPRAPRAWPWPARPPGSRARPGSSGTSDGRHDLSRHGRLTREYDRAEDGNVALTGEVDLAACGGAVRAGPGLRRRTRRGRPPGPGQPAGRPRRAPGGVRPATGRTGRRRSIPPKPAGGRAAATSTGSARPSCRRTTPRASRARSSPASRPPGASRGATRRRSGHGRLSPGLAPRPGRVGRRPARGRGEARGAPRAPPTSGPPRRPTATGRRTCGSAAPSTGPASSSARPPSRSSSSTCSAATGRSPTRDLARYWPMVRRAAALHRPERPVDPAGPLGEPAGLHPVHPGGRDRRAADRRRPGRRAGRARRSATYLRETADAWNAADRELALRHRHRPGPPPRGRRLLRAEHPARAGRAGHAPARARAGSTETPAAEGGRPRHRGRQPRRAGAGPVRAPRRRTTRGSSTRSRSIDAAPEGRDAPRPRLAPLQRRRLRREAPTARPTTGSDGGIGRAWPLLTGERAHYELAAGRRDEAVRLLHAMESFAGDGGMIPEQVWDSDDIPERGPVQGPARRARPCRWPGRTPSTSSSAARSRTAASFDRPPQTVAALPGEKVGSRPASSGGSTTRGRRSRRARSCGSKSWRPPSSAGAADGWKTTRDVRDPRHRPGHPRRRPGHGGAEEPGDTIAFTFHWTEADRWEGRISPCPWSDRLVRTAVESTPCRTEETRTMSTAQRPRGRRHHRGVGRGGPRDGAGVRQARGARRPAGPGPRGAGGRPPRRRGAGRAGRSSLPTDVADAAQVEAAADGGRGGVRARSTSGSTTRWSRSSRPSSRWRPRSTAASPR